MATIRCRGCDKVVDVDPIQCPYCSLTQPNRAVDSRRAWLERTLAAALGALGAVAAGALLERRPSTPSPAVPPPTSVRFVPVQAPPSTPADRRADPSKKRLLGRWLFDESNGSTIPGTDGSCGDAVLGAGVTLVPGRDGLAAEIDDRPSGRGVRLAAECGRAIDDLPEGTIEFWTMSVVPPPDSTMPKYSFVQKQHDGSNTMMLLVLDWKGKLVWHPANHQPECTAQIGVRQDVWRHLAVTWDNSMTRLYADGKIAAECEGSSGLPQDPNPTCLSIGGDCHRGNGGVFRMDDVRIYGYALGPGDISDHQRERKSLPLSL